MSKAEAEEWKAKGNKFFSAGDFLPAIENFTKAIETDSSNHVYFSNRSACYASLKRFDEALSDAKKCVEINPSWAKGYSRLGGAYFGQGQHQEAVNAYEQGLKLDPSNEGLLSGKRDAEAAMMAPPPGQADPMAQMANIFGAPDVMEKLGANPKTAPFIMQPDFVAKLAQIRQNPSLLGQHFQDPRMMAALGVLMGIDMTAMDPNAAGGDEEMQRDFEAERRERQKKEEAERKQKEEEERRERERREEEEMDDGEREKRRQLQLSVTRKEEGNAAYKKKDFATALAKYEEAHTLNPTNALLLNNVAAVYTEMGDFAQAFDVAQKAYDIAVEQRAPFAEKAKILLRMGTAKMKEDKLEDAVVWLRKSLSEQRTAACLERLNSCEKALKEAERLAYISPELSKEAKEQGNELFKQGKYPEAVQCYSEAIKRNPDDHVPYSNRAACYQKLGAWNEGLKDCDACLKIEPSFIKAHSRKGAMYFFMKEYHKALDAYRLGLTFDANNADLMDGYQRVVAAINGSSDKATDEERARHAMNDPEIQQILQDPMIQQVLKDLQNGSSAAQGHLQNPVLMKKIEKLVRLELYQ